ncbi:hypothetical protein [uncultured Campylobacter sp.]|nr:hypothetical protein [uncultured Campylobacter sp.]
MCHCSNVRRTSNLTQIYAKICSLAQSNLTHNCLLAAVKFT